MILELTGLPGSGKTTFAKKLAEGGAWKVVTIHRRSELLYYNLTFFLFHPIKFVLGFGWLVSYRGKKSLWYTKLMNLFFVHNAKYMKASRYPRAIIDQGHHQNIISLFDDVLPGETLASYLKFLPTPDVLLLFIADTKTRGRNMVERGYTVRMDMEEGERLAWQAASEENFEMLYLSRGSISTQVLTVTPKDEEAILHRCSNLSMIRFVMRLRMPTEKAHGIQIAKTLEALANEGEMVELWVPTRKNILFQSISEYYGLSHEFPVRNIPMPDSIRFSRIVGTAAYFLDAIIFLFVLYFSRIDTESIYITRNAEVAWLLRRKGARVFLEAHQWPTSKHRLLKYFLRNISGIIANSDGTGDAFKNALLAPVEVIRNGADLDKFMTDLTQLEARKILNLSPDKCVVMYVGGFYAWKGVPIVLRAWEERFKNKKEILLVMVGGGEVELAKEGGLAEYRSCTNILLAPHQSSSVIPTYLRAADMLLLPNDPITIESRLYTSPIKLFEYMASGRPIIASLLPSTKEVLSDETALFVRPGSSEDLADGIEKLLRDRAFGERLAHKARLHVKQYDWSHRAKRLLSFVRSEK